MSNSDLFANQIDSGDLFRNRVFDLQARVDFQEISLAIFDQELAGADTYILNRVKECAGVLLKCCVEFFGNEGSRCFFNNLLVAALDRAISRRNDCESSERIASALGFDVTTVRNEFLHEAQRQRRRIAEVRVEIANIRVGIHASNSAPTAAIGALDQDRVANGVCQLECILDAASFQGTTGDRWDLARISQFAGSNLVPQCFDGLGGRANPHQSGFCDAGGEIGVLGKEAVSGVDCLRARLCGGLENRFRIQVGLSSALPTQAVGGGCELAGQGIPIGLSVDSDGIQTHFAKGTDDANRNFTSVRN